MLTNCLAACAHLSITVSEIQRDTCEKKSAFLHTPLHSTPPLGGFPSQYRHPFAMGKLEWCRYPMVKKFRTYLFVLAQLTNVTDGRTDRHRVTAIAALCIAYRTAKIAVFTYSSPHFCFPWRRPCDYHAIMFHGCKDNSMLAKPLASCIYLY